ncbi:MAG: hypothetical protein QXU48_06325, partial [Thermoplasmata archaeon]
SYEPFNKYMKVWFTPLISFSLWKIGKGQRKSLCGSYQPSEVMSNRARRETYIPRNNVLYPS